VNVLEAVVALLNGMTTLGFNGFCVIASIDSVGRQVVENVLFIEFISENFG